MELGGVGCGGFSFRFSVFMEEYRIRIWILFIFFVFWNKVNVDFKKRCLDFVGRYCGNSGRGEDLFCISVFCWLIWNIVFVNRGGSMVVSVETFIGNSGFCIVSLSFIITFLVWRDTICIFSFLFLCKLDIVGGKEFLI